MAPVGTVLITGGAGYIGSFTSLALLEHGYEVIVVDSLYNASETSLDRVQLLCGKRPAFHKVDICDEEALDKVFAAHPNIDSVIHFAALKVPSLHCPHKKESPKLTPQPGRWRILRNPTGILPRQCRRNNHPPPLHDQAQRPQHRLLLVRNRIRRRQ